MTFAQNLKALALNPEPKAVDAATAQSKKDDVAITDAYVQFWYCIVTNDGDGVVKSFLRMPVAMRRRAMQQPIPAATARAVFIEIPKIEGQSRPLAQNAALKDVALRANEGESLGFTPGVPAAVAAAAGHVDALIALRNCRPKANLNRGDTFKVDDDQMTISPMGWAAHYGEAAAMGVLVGFNVVVDDALAALNLKIQPETVRWLATECKLAPSNFYAAMQLAIDRAVTLNQDEQESEYQDASSNDLPLNAPDASKQRVREELTCLVRIARVALDRPAPGYASDGWLLAAINQSRWHAVSALVALGAPHSTVPETVETADEGQTKAKGTAPKGKPLLRFIMESAPSSCLEAFLSTNAKVDDSTLVAAIVRAGVEPDVGAEMFGLLYRHSGHRPTSAAARDLFHKAYAQKDLRLARLCQALYNHALAKETKKSEDVVANFLQECDDLAEECFHTLEDGDEFTDEYPSGDANIDLGGGGKLKMRSRSDAAKAAFSRGLGKLGLGGKASARKQAPQEQPRQGLVRFALTES